ncbi:MAG: DUF4082 domain-containing protein [Chloroflexi bacterium]|nr:DUF4082 domain-containing protein [Chloroflexota bacterium]MCC6894672.1 DUF4082 domain-containing protein [Anaerolineae bacterium]
MKKRWIFFLILMLLAVASTTYAAPAEQGTTAPNPANYKLTSVITGLTKPIYVTHAGDNTGRLFIVEQSGKIKIWQNGAVLPTPFLDVGTLIATGGSEQGLLGLAFPPNFATSKQFYINYTNVQGDTVIARYTVSTTNANVANAASATQVLFVDQPYTNHNGGNMNFGKDGLLYVGMGDGGSGGDPQNYAQNPNSLLGKMLRINVTQANFPVSVWALGIRNPWRWSFDRLTGDFYMGDVGQGNWEEINFWPANGAAGANYGWNTYEGNHNYKAGSIAGAIFPIAEYSHADGCSVTGGYVYRGANMPAFQGYYVYADYCNGNMWTAFRSNNVWQSARFLTPGFSISSFGEDQAGELYVVGYAGTIYRLDTVAAATPTKTNTPAPTATKTNTPMATPTKTNTPVPTVTKTNTPLPTPTKTNTPGQVTCPCSLWPNSATPAVPDYLGTAPIELGVKFQSNINAIVTGLRFYKGPSNTGTHTGHLWSSTGTLLATATFMNESASGWQTVNFSAPVAISANTLYIASYHSSSGRFSYTANAFTTALVNGPLTAPAHSTASPNGVFRNGSNGTFPNMSSNNVNYWVDVIVVPGTLPTSTPVPPTPTKTNTVMPTLTKTFTPQPTPTKTNTPAVPTATGVQPSATPVMPTATLVTTIAPTPTQPTTGGATLKVDVVPQTADIGTGVLAQINLLNVTNLYGLQLVCKVNPSVLNGVGLLKGDGFNDSNSFIIDQGFKPDGSWTIAASRLSPATPISGNLLAFTLGYTTAGAGSSSVECTALAVDQNGRDLQLTVVNGAFTGNGPVSTVEPTPQPSATIPPTATVAPTQTLPPTLTPTPQPSMGSISGIALYQGREDATGITVYLLTSDAQVLQEQPVDPEGNFYFANLAPGSYIVGANGAGFIPLAYNTAVAAAGGSVDIGTITLRAGDVDGNRKVDLADAGLIGANFNVPVPPAPELADLNKDKIVDVRDLVLVGGNFGLTGPVVLP